jgi:hypothetical protein
MAPLLNGGAGVTGAVDSLWQWLNKPFTQAMSPVDIWLLVGIVLLSVIAWNFILYHVRIAAEAV